MFKKRKEAVSSVPDNITRRVVKLGSGVIGSYVETAVSDTGRYSRLYEASGEEAYLDEAILNSQVVLALLTEMKNRAI